MRVSSLCNKIMTLAKWIKKNTAFVLDDDVIKMGDAIGQCY